MRTYFVVTGVVKNKDKVLILKKSPKDWNYPNKWSFCSGYVKEFESAEDTVLREIREETKLRAKITKRGKLFEKYDNKNGKNWVIQPFLCNANSSKVKLDHENVEFKWVYPSEITKYDLVPALKKDLKALNLL